MKKIGLSVLLMFGCAKWVYAVDPVTEATFTVQATIANGCAN